MKVTTIFIVPRLVDYCCSVVVKTMGIANLLTQPLPPEIKDYITEEGEVCPTCNNYFYSARNYNTTYGYKLNDDTDNSGVGQYIQVSVSCCSRKCMEGASYLYIPLIKTK